MKIKRGLLIALVAVSMVSVVAFAAPKKTSLPSNAIKLFPGAGSGFEGTIEFLKPRTRKVYDFWSLSLEYANISDTKRVTYALGVVNYSNKKSVRPFQKNKYSIGYAGDNTQDAYTLGYSCIFGVEKAFWKDISIGAEATLFSADVTLTDRKFGGVDWNAQLIWLDSYRLFINIPIS